MQTLYQNSREGKSMQILYIVSIYIKKGSSQNCISVATEPHYKGGGNMRKSRLAQRWAVVRGFSYG